MPEDVASPNLHTPPTEAFPNGQPYVCVAIQITACKKTDTLNVATVGQRLIKNITYSLCAVELMFACTFDKCQGKTLAYIIMCLHCNPWKMAQLSHLYTALSRVMKGRCLRVWPAANLSRDLDRLRNFKFSTSVVALDFAYDERGVFREERYIQKWNEFNSASAQPSRPAEIRMNRPRPAVISVITHSRWYVPFLRLAFELPIDMKREWIEGVEELQQHWDLAVPIEHCLIELRRAYHFTEQYEVFQNFIANLPNGYIPPECQEFLLGDFRVWNDIHVQQKMAALHPSVIAAYNLIHEISVVNRHDDFYNMISDVCLELQSSITRFITFVNETATAEYEREALAVRVANAEAQEQFDAIHFADEFSVRNTRSSTAGQGRGRGQNRSHGRGRGCASGTHAIGLAVGNERAGLRCGRGRGPGRGHECAPERALSGRGSGRRGRGRGRY